MRFPRGLQMHDNAVIRDLIRLHSVDSSGQTWRWGPTSKQGSKTIPIVFTVQAHANITCSDTGLGPYSCIPLFLLQITPFSEVLYTQACALTWSRSTLRAHVTRGPRSPGKCSRRGLAFSARRVTLFFPNHHLLLSQSGLHKRTHLLFPKG